MSLLRFNITMSADGYTAGPNQSLTNPLGEGAMELHNWARATRAFRAMHGMGDAGDTGPDDAIIDETFDNLGATIMGRHMFGGGTGPWDESWRGWWDENPPYHHPVFVLTHHPRKSLPMEGGTTFHFVTDGIGEALKRAKAAAGRKDVSLAGGANVSQQFLKAGFVDEMELHIVPLMLGAGERLFEHTDGQQARYECIRVVNSPSVAHYKYRRRA